LPHSKLFIMSRKIYQLIVIALLLIVAISCKKEPVAGVKLEERFITLAVGRTATLTVIIIPDNAANQTVSWESSDIKVASVDNGKVTAKAVGKATITVTTQDGNFTAICEVTVLQPIEPEMVLVEGGTFTMGCTDDECASHELPTHKITLSNFNIGKYTITQKEWKAIMNFNPSYSKDDEKPVTMVDWNDIQSYIQKLNTLTGKNYRLPTEAEWEYAARGGNKSENYKYSGSDNVDEVAWYDGKTYPVGLKKPNELDIYDMSGNVFEVCGDWYGVYTDAPQTNPTGPATGTGRIARGGNYNNMAFYCRVVSRVSPKNLKAQNAGFRLVHP